MRLLCPALWPYGSSSKLRGVSSLLHLAMAPMTTLGLKPPYLVHLTPIFSPAPSAFLRDIWSVPRVSGRPGMQNTFLPCLAHRVALLSSHLLPPNSTPAQSFSTDQRVVTAFLGCILSKHGILNSSSIYWINSIRNCFFVWC